MGCDTLFEINTLIFEEFFRNNDDLSNLYNFLVVNNNEFCIANITANDFLSNSTSGSPDLDAFFVGSPTDTDYNCNLESGFASFSNIVKDTAYNTYSLELYSEHTTHYIPQFSSTIIQYIDTDKQLKMRQIFNIYQIYDYFVNNPEKIATNNLDGLTLYDYFDPTTTSSIPNKTNCPISSLDHKDYIENQLRGKLTPSIVYVCRGIYLVLLYKQIADVYLTYYKICDDLTSGSCGERTKTNIQTVLKQFSAVTNKIKEFSGYYLNVNYNNNSTLTIDTEGATVISFFELLEKDKHTIYNKTKRKYITIKNNISISSDKSNYHLIEGDIEGTIANNFADNDKCVILSKNIEYSSQVYNDSLDTLSSANEIFNKNKSEYQKSIGNYNAIQGSFNNIDYIYYLTIIIVIISLIAIVATNSEQSRKTRVFIILIIVLLTYGMIFSFIEVAKRFTENFSTDTDTDITREQNIINNNFDMYLRIIYMESSNYGMTRLYNTLTDASNKETQNVRNNNKLLESSINRNDATTNAEWHRLFQRTLFIHTTFLFLILVLTYLWLSIIMPDMNIYLLFITIIASMILIFYYFRNLHRVVRTEYKHRYWTKMSV